jgi:hypothetical protein
MPYINESDNPRASSVFDNPIPARVVRKAAKQKQAYIRKFGDDSGTDYPLAAADNPVLGPELGVKTVVIGQQGGRTEGGASLEALDTARGMVVGNIRMGFGHYRIAMAIASAAHARGLVPYWFDLASFGQTTGGKVIRHLNELYSLGSRWSQKYPLFNKLYWEPLNSEGFKKLAYNAGDQVTSTLMTPAFGKLPKDMPFAGTHVWPAQAAVHAGMRSVVNVIPDNWPMALHLAEGSIHAIQCPSSWCGYRTLREFGGAGRALKLMPAGSMVYTGHYIDHELVANIEDDCRRRIARVAEGRPRRLLLTVGGAGAQREIFGKIIASLLPEIKAGKLALYVNVGDHRAVWDGLAQDVAGLDGDLVTRHFDDWAGTKAFAAAAIDGPVSGIHAFCHSDIFAAVYATNLLMRSADVLVTKPSELAFYPIPKLFIKRIGGHEAWGAIRGAELGDGTFECDTWPLVSQALQLMLREDDLLPMMNDAIVKNKAAGHYDGAYKVVELALKAAGRA